MVLVQVGELGPQLQHFAAVERRFLYVPPELLTRQAHRWAATCARSAVKRNQTEAPGSICPTTAEGYAPSCDFTARHSQAQTYVRRQILSRPLKEQAITTCVQTPGILLYKPVSRQVWAHTPADRAPDFCLTRRHAPACALRRAQQGLERQAPPAEPGSTKAKSDAG